MYIFENVNQFFQRFFKKIKKKILKMGLKYKKKSEAVEQGQNHISANYILDLSFIY